MNYYSLNLTLIYIKLSKKFIFSVTLTSFSVLNRHACLMAMVLDSVDKKLTRLTKASCPLCLPCWLTRCIFADRKLPFGSTSSIFPTHRILYLQRWSVLLQNLFDLCFCYCNLQFDQHYKILMKNEYRNIHCSGKT